MSDDEVTRFTPWRVIYEHIRTLNVDEVVTYETLSGLLGVDFTQNRTPFYRARKELEDNDMHTMVVVANVGYRVPKAIEHEKVARGLHKSGTRKVKRSVSTIRAADRAELTQEVRERFDLFEQTAQRHADMLRRLNGDVKGVKRDLRETRRQTQGDIAAVDSRVDRLTEAMVRAGIEVREVV